GATGPTGPTGASAIIPFASGIPLSLTTIAGGLVGTPGFVGFGDHYAGLALAAGSLAALHKKAQTGKGERVTVSLFHTAIYG
ncbi:CoA transferase, partial [Clostridioides difficile]|uniref:CoA transferase n=1 Tax=Clostridioides difficile TaxID=1496 RepID=UPI001EED9AFD